MIPIQNYSEFVGLPYKEQKEKIKKGLTIFKKYGIKTNVFVALAHWIDKITFKVLKEFNFKYISDGFRFYPKKINGIYFLLQQLWQYRYLPIGYKTICLHLENFKKLNNKILNKIGQDKHLFGNFDILLNINEENFLEKIINFIFKKIGFTLLKIKNARNI